MEIGIETIYSAPIDKYYADSQLVDILPCPLCSKTLCKSSMYAHITRQYCNKLLIMNEIDKEKVKSLFFESNPRRKSNPT